MVKGKFKSRPNRFIAEVSIDGRIEKAHVKNTGRLKELLTEGASIYLQDHIDSMGSRKLRYSLIAVEKDGQIVNIDSQVPNKVVHEALVSQKICLPGMESLDSVQPETSFGNSRFDFYVEDICGNRAFIEVKGCTLNEDGTGRFPDAPSTRAVKHVNELSELCSRGYQAYIIFVCAMKGVSFFEANRQRHPEFADSLAAAKAGGVGILCYDCIVTKDSIDIDKEIPILI